MVSFNNNTRGGAGKAAGTNSQAAAKKKQPPSGAKTDAFKGNAKTESVLHNKVITNKSGQSGQIIALVGVLATYSGVNNYSDWAESIENNVRKERAAFLPTRVSMNDYGSFTGDVFAYNGNDPAVEVINLNGRVQTRLESTNGTDMKNTDNRSS